MKVTKKNEEIVLDEIVPNTASMIVSASPNLATTGFGTPGKPVPPLSPGILHLYNLVFLKPIFN